MENNTTIDKELYPVEKVADIILKKKVDTKREEITENIKEVLLTLDGLNETYHFYEKEIPGFFEDKNNIRIHSGNIIWDLQHHLRHIGKGEIQPIVKEYLEVYEKTINETQKELIQAFSDLVEKTRLDKPITYKIEKEHHSIWPGEMRIT
ncbi:MAG: hypothetical protein WCO66_03215 [Candidatus Absconditabacteria bacterium]